VYIVPGDYLAALSKDFVYLLRRTSSMFPHSTELLSYFAALLWTFAYLLCVEESLLDSFAALHNF
jgi:hypothetical protein